MRTVLIAPDHGEIGLNAISSEFVQFVMEKVSSVHCVGMESVIVSMLNIVFMCEAAAMKQCIKG